MAPITGALRAFFRPLARALAAVPGVSGHVIGLVLVAMTGVLAVRPAPDVKPPVVIGSLWVFTDRPDAEATVRVAVNNVNLSRVRFSPYVQIDVDYWYPPASPVPEMQAIRLEGDFRLHTRKNFDSSRPWDPSLPLAAGLGDFTVSAIDVATSCTGPCHAVRDGAEPSKPAQLVVGPPAALGEGPRPPRAGLAWAGRVTIMGRPYRPFWARDLRRLAVRAPAIQSSYGFDHKVWNRAMPAHLGVPGLWYTPANVDTEWSFPHLVPRDPRFELRAVPEPAVDGAFGRVWRGPNGAGPSFDVVDTRAQRNALAAQVVFGALFAVGLSFVPGWWGRMWRG